MDQTMNLGTTKGLSFAELLDTFVPKELAVGKHVLVFKEMDVTKVSYNAKAEREEVKALAHVDEEEHNRTHVFTPTDLSFMMESLKRTHPELMNGTVRQIVARLIAEEVKLDFWVVENVTERGNVFYNWNFYEPVKVEESTAGTTASTFA